MSASKKTHFHKIWLIDCKIYTEEFPKLNDFINQSKGKDILFNSLALDTKAQLEKFLQDTIFEYKVIPNLTDFINHTFQTQIYPKHYSLNKQGTLQKVDSQSLRTIEY